MIKISIAIAAIIENKLKSSYYSQTQENSFVKIASMLLNLHIEEKSTTEH